MRKANVIRGRIEEHGVGVGTLTDDMVRERAREIAVINGRQEDQFTQTDLDQAREELEAAQNAAEQDADAEAEAFAPREGPMGVSSGRAAQTKLPSDEQMLAADLVEEGVEEATHEQMLQGSLESRRRDERFDDQLPSTEE